MLANKSSICPLCDKFISKNVSTPFQLPYPLAP